jgi:PAS domain S-box-containing protein
MNTQEKRKPGVWRYPALIIRILPLLIVVPFCIVLFGDMNGSSVQDAITRSWRIISAPYSIFTFWAPLFLAVLAIYGYLAPIIAFSCGICREANPRREAKLVLKRLNKLHFVIIFFSIAGFCASEIMMQAAHGLLQNGNFNDKFMLFNAATKGLLAGVILSFNLDNILFPAKTAVIAALPGKRLKKTSLYRKIALVVSAIVLFLVFQFFAMSTQFYDLGSQYLTPDKGADVQRTLFEHATDSQKIHDILGLVYLKSFIYLIFVIELVMQLKYMIQHPLDTMKDRLAILNSEDAKNATSIDIVSNDEFSRVFQEINTLIERQKSELECSSTRLESIVDQAADPIIAFDRSGKILLFNPAAELLFGYSEDEAKKTELIRMIELPQNERCPAEGQTCEANSTEDLIGHLGGEESAIHRFVAIRKDGSRVMFESNVSHAENADTTIYTAILRDITKQVEFEQALTSAKVSAENANRLKTEFLANMSHELRTPLNAVLGFTQLLSSDRNLTPGQLEKIQIISRSGEHLLSLINDILDISKIEAGKQEIHESVFDPTRFVGDIQEMFSLRCQKAGLSLYVEIAGDLPKKVVGDLGKLRQVMINLVGNAVKFTSEGGVGIIVGPDDGKIRFSVTDSGKGVPEDELDAIMQPFIQSSITDNEGGTGLGLAISSRYIQMMGGQISVQSEVGKGSTFSFAIELPETDAPLPEMGMLETAVAVKKGSSALALIVDDKEVNRLVLKEMLEAAGFLTMEAENGKVAVERTREFRPAVVFMDIKMPVMDGFESMRTIKGDPAVAKTPVFALTASAFTNDEKKILDAGFDGFLAKPFKRSALFRIIREKSGVELEYETAEIHAEKTVPDASKIDFAAAARVLGTGRISELADSVLINDFTAIRVFADRIRGDLPEFAALVAWHAESFDETNLEAILKDLEAGTELNNKGQS